MSSIVFGAGGVSRSLGRVLFAILLLGAVQGASGVEPEATDLEISGRDSAQSPAESPPPEAAKTVALDELLRLPQQMTFDNEVRNGANSNAWRSRFRVSLAEIAAAEKHIAETREELDQLAGTGGGSQWQMSAPGSNNTEVTPMSFKLREELREGKERLEEAERKHRALVIQADLAGVPVAWRHPN